MVFTITKNVDITEDVDRGCLWKQYLLSFMLSFPFFTQGVQTITLSTSAHSGHFVTPDVVPWSTTALIISAAVSAPLYSCISDRWGRKFGFYLVIMLQGISCIPLLLSPNHITIIILHILAGVTSGGLFTVLPIYIRELCAEHIKASMVALLMAMTSAGYLVKLAVGVETLMYVMVGLVMFQFLAVFLAIESPSYLVMVDKLEMAVTNLAKLKCVDEDNSLVVKEISYLKDESERAKSNGNLNVFRILKNRIYRDVTKIGVVLYTVTILSGSIIFLDQEKTLQQLKTEADPEKLLVPICLSAGGITSVVVLRFLERKYYLTLAYSAMVLAMGTLAVYTQAELTVTQLRWAPLVCLAVLVFSYGMAWGVIMIYYLTLAYSAMVLAMGTLAVYTQAELTVTQLRWAPLVCLAVLVFSYGMAWGVPAVVMVEILNIEIRSTMLATLYTYSQLLKLAHVHSFHYFKEAIGIYTLLYIFTGINLFGAVYTISQLPNIKNKTVKQVERQLKRVPIFNMM